MGIRTRTRSTAETRSPSASSARTIELGRKNDGADWPLPNGGRERRRARERKIGEHRLASQRLPLRSTSLKLTIRLLLFFFARTPPPCPPSNVACQNMRSPKRRPREESHFAPFPPFLFTRRYLVITRFFFGSRTSSLIGSVVPLPVIRWNFTQKISICEKKSWKSRNISVISDSERTICGLDRGRM